MGTRMSLLNAAPQALGTRDAALPGAAVGWSQEGPWVLPSPTRNLPAPQDKVPLGTAARVAAGTAWRSSQRHR